MPEFSFDIVSKFDRQELRNAVNQAVREIQTRYDLKDTRSTVELDERSIVINTASEMTLSSIRDLLESKLVRRGLSLKILDYGKIEEASGGRVRQAIALKEGIAEDLAKQLARTIRGDFKKVTPQIQGDAVRVSAKSKDDLQAVIQAMRKREDEYPVALQFVNYR
jgi:cyclic-di-GMP-binding protein